MCLFGNQSGYQSTSYNDELPPTAKNVAGDDDKRKRDRQRAASTGDGETLLSAGTGAGDFMQRRRETGRPGRMYQ